MAQQVSTTQQTTLSITGMHCASCANTLTKKLSNTKGVEAATVNFATANASITHHTTITAQELMTVVQKTGYSAAIPTANEQDHNQTAKKYYSKKFLISILFSLPALLIGMLFMKEGIFFVGKEIAYAQFLLLILATPVQFYVGWDFYKGTWTALKNKTASMDSLIAIGTSAAYAYSVYTVFFKPELGQYFEVSTVLITLVLLGKYLEANAKERTHNAISTLMNAAPTHALVLRKGKEIRIPVDDVKEGDSIKVKPGQNIPVDGIVVSGNSAIDESMITGESMPVEKTKGSKVTAGTINKEGSFIFKATAIGKNTTLAKIAALIEDAQARKAPIQRFADIVSAWFVPVVIVIAIITFFTWILLGKNVEFALLTSVAVLVIACPCALGLATPTAIMVSTGKGAHHGILIKGGDILETTHQVTHVLFDKTGTLTQGKPEVHSIVPIEGTEHEATQLMASLEQHSEHPLATAIMDYARKNKIHALTTTGFKAIPGKGVKARINTKEYTLGIPEITATPDKSTQYLMHKLEQQGNTVMLLSQGKKLIAMVAVADSIKPTTHDAIEQLKHLGLSVHMITGDNERTARAIAHQAGIEHVHARVLPDKKAAIVKLLQKKGITAMIGDGINDAPALAQADIGIAMGSGTDVALETGDIVLMKNDLRDISKAIMLSKITISKIKQNMFWALFYNILGIPIAAGVLYPVTGTLLSPIVAGGAMALSSVSVVMNSLMLKYKKL